jgi:hypothetical protein
MVRRIQLLGAALLLPVVLLVAGDAYSVGKNILHIRFDTVTVHSVPTQVVINCWYKLDTVKPHNFHALGMNFIYEAFQMQPTTPFFFDGTACAMADFKIASTDAQTGNARVEVLSQQEFDLSKPLLFSFNVIVKSTLNGSIGGDTVALMEIVNIDTAQLNMGIDSISIENGWIKYVKLPPTPEKRKNVTLSSDSLSLKADSTGWVSLRVSSLDSARLKRGGFSFEIDTALVRFDTARAGELLTETSIVQIAKLGGKVTIDFSEADTSKAITGAGEILQLRFTARHREDTACAILRDTSFFALNTDNLLDTVSYRLDDVCVYGAKKDTGTGYVRMSEDEEKEFKAMPNPAREFVEFTSKSDAPDLAITIYTVLGEKVSEFRFGGSYRWDVSRVAAGAYRALASRRGKIIGAADIAIIH